MPEQQQQSQQKILGGSLFLKLLVVIAIIIIAVTFLGGVKFDLASIFWAGLKFGLGLIIIIFVFWGITSKLFKPPVPQPNEDWRNTIIQGALRRKPRWVKKCYLRGEDMLAFTFWFNVLGLMYLPSHIPKRKVDAQGNPIYTKKLDVRNKIIKDKDNMPIMIPEYEELTEKDGEWVIVGKKDPWWMFWKKDFEVIRADITLVSYIGNNIWIKCVNLVPFNNYLYPNQQWQDDIDTIHARNKDEVANETIKDWLNWTAQVAKAGIANDPTMLRFMELQGNSIAQQNQPLLLRQP